MREREVGIDWLYWLAGWHLTPHTYGNHASTSTLLTEGIAVLRSILLCLLCACATFSQVNTKKKEATKHSNRLTDQ